MGLQFLLIFISGIASGIIITIVTGNAKNKNKIN